MYLMYDKDKIFNECFDFELIEKENVDCFEIRYEVRYRDKE